MGQNDKFEKWRQSNGTSWEVMGRIDLWGQRGLATKAAIDPPLSFEVRWYTGVCSYWLMINENGMRLIPAKEGGREGTLPTPPCNNFSQVLGSLEIYEAFSMSITFKRCCEEKRKAFSCIGFSYSPLSDLMDFKGKLLLGKSRNEKCKMSLLEGSIGLLDSISVQKATEGQLLPRNTQNMGYQVRSQITPRIF